MPGLLPDALVSKTYRESGGHRWTLGAEEFAAALEASVAHAFSGTRPSDREVAEYVGRLHLEDLALACACALGRDAAWDGFVHSYRPGLYRAADALDPSGGAREIADSLYAELYGVRSGAGSSLFSYFHGRSSLATWLRAVLSQRYVDRLRRTRREEPLPEDEVVHPHVRTSVEDPDRATLVPLVHRAVRAGVDALPPKDRLRLRSYHAGELTLAQIGRITGEHESTVSRALARTRRDLRASAEAWLRRERGLTAAQVARAFELAVEDPGELDLRTVFGQDARKVRP